MDISKFDKADILAALYNRSKVQGLGFINAMPGDMTKDAAQTILDSGQSRFDYLYGRVMKVNLSGPDMNTTGYNRDNGEGAAERVLAALDQPQS